jgi:hypothetical protein
MSLTIEYASTAQCRPEHIWQVFEQIELWPRWAPQAVREVRWVSGEPWTKGAKFSVEMLKPVAFKLTPEVLEVESPIYIHLRGQGSKISGEQHFIFKWMPIEQTTELRTLQEFSGGPIQLFGNSIKPALEAGIKHLFARVIEEAESLVRAQEPGAPVSDPEPSHGEPKPPIGDPAPPPGEPVPPVGGPAPAPGETAPQSGDFRFPPTS